NPGRKGEWVLRILKETGGLAGDAEDEEIIETQRLLARTEGIWAGPTGVAALAVLRRLLAARALDPDATICVILSETGLKTEARASERQAPACAQDWEARAGATGPRRRPSLAPGARPLPSRRRHMKRLLAAALLALMPFPVPPAEAQSLVATFKRVNPSVVIIRARWKEVDRSGQSGRVNEVGSGVLISADGQVIIA